MTPLHEGPSTPRTPSAASSDATAVLYEPMPTLTPLSQLPPLKEAVHKHHQPPDGPSASRPAKIPKLTARKTTGGRMARQEVISQTVALPSPSPSQSQSASPPPQALPKRKSNGKHKPSRFVYVFDNNSASSSPRPEINFTPVKLMNLKSLQGPSTSPSTPNLSSQPSILRPIKPSPLSAPSISTLISKSKSDKPSSFSSSSRSHETSSTSLLKKNTARKSTKRASSQFTDTDDRVYGAHFDLEPHSRPDSSDEVEETLEDRVPGLTEEETNELISHAQRYFRQSLDTKPSKGSKPSSSQASQVPLGLTNISRSKFEAVISKNTSEETHAPKIRLVNLIDDDPCPKLDFFWTNSLLYGRNVPRPVLPIDSSLKRRRWSRSMSSEDEIQTTAKGKGKAKWTNSLSQGIEGCDCVGDECDPSSCSCANKQAIETALSDANPKPDGFMYHSANSDMPEGTLKSVSIRILECNELCKCSLNCVNRLVQLGRNVKIGIQKTRDKGWGLFAKQFMPTGTFIGIYAGEIITSEEANRRGTLYDFLGTSYLFDLDEDEELEGDSKCGYAIDARYAGNHTRFLNHSCDPNCSYVPVAIPGHGREIYQLALFTLQEVDDEEELTCDYSPSLGEAPAHKHHTNGRTSTGAVHVRCKCGSSNCRGIIWM